MQSKTAKVEILGQNNGGTINSVFAPNITSDSNITYRNISPDDMLSRSVTDCNITSGEIYLKDTFKEILITLVDSSHYMYSLDKGESWTISAFYDEAGNNLSKEHSWDGIAYDGYDFYACPRIRTTTPALVSDNGIIWKKFEEASGGELRWVIPDDTGGVFNGCKLIYYDLEKSTSLYRGNKLLHTFNNCELNRVRQSSQSILFYNQYGGSVFAIRRNSSEPDSDAEYIEIKDLEGSFEYCGTGSLSGQKFAFLTKNTNGAFVVNIVEETYIVENNVSKLQYSIVSSINTRLQPNTSEAIPQHSSPRIGSDTAQGVYFAVDWQHVNGSYPINGLAFVDVNENTVKYSTNSYGCSFGTTYYYQKVSEHLSEYRPLFVSIKDVFLKENGKITDKHIISAYKTPPSLDRVSLNSIANEVPINYNNNDSIENFDASAISKNAYGLRNGILTGIKYTEKSNLKQNSSGDYTINFKDFMFIYGKNISRLLLFFDKENDIYPTSLIVNGVEYKNDKNYMVIDFGYGRYDTVVIQFLALNKPEEYLTIGGVSADVNCVFSRKNGLNSLTVSSIDSAAPLYGVISYSGDVEINDISGILKILSDCDLLPNVLINVYVNDTLKYTFAANSGVKYLDKSASATINLLDRVQYLQSLNIQNQIYLTDITALQLFNALVSEFPYNVVMADGISDNLSKIKIAKVLIKDSSWWDIWNSFCVGTKTIFYKDINDVYRLGV